MLPFPYKHVNYLDYLPDAYLDEFKRKTRGKKFLKPEKDKKRIEFVVKNEGGEGGERKRE